MARTNGNPADVSGTGGVEGNGLAFTSGSNFSGYITESKGESAQAVCDFLNRLRPGGPWVLTAIKPDGPTTTTATVRNENEIRDFIAKFNGERNLYYSVNPTRGSMTTKAKKTDIAAVEFALADCDPIPGETPEAAKARYLAATGTPKPTAVVDSGNGLQFLWRFERPLVLAEPVDGNYSRETLAQIDDVEGRIAYVMEKLGTVAGTQNIDRILRLPGTVNLPNEAKRKKGRTACQASLLSWKDNAYPLDAFPPPPAKESGGRKKKLIDIDGLAVNLRFKAIIKTGEDPEGEYPGRSECVWALCLALTAAGYSDDVIRQFLLDTRYPISAHVLDQAKPEDYAARQIEKARVQTLDPDVARLNEEYCFVMEAGKAVVLQERKDAGRTLYVRITPSDFKLSFANRKIPNQKGKLVGVGDVWLEHPQRRQFLGGVVFDPSEKQNRDDVLNLWTGFAYEPKAGSWALMKDHINKVICNGVTEHFEYLMNWMARLVQRPGEQGMVAVVTRGAEGTGKGLLGRTLVRLLGQHGLQITNAKHLVGNFNAHLRDCVLLFADEAFYAGDKQHVSILKGIITEPELTIEAKYANAATFPNFLHLFMASNENWVVPAGLEARRFFVLEVSKDRMNDQEYFRRIHEELEAGGYEAMLAELQARDISEFKVQKFPLTEALQEQKMHSLPTEFKWWQDVLMRGFVGAQWDGWKEKVPTDLLYDEYLEFLKAHYNRRPLNRVHFGRFLSQMGGTSGRFRSKSTERRIYGYDLGSLNDARAAFDKATGITTAWPNEEGFIEIIKEPEIPF